MTRTGWKAAPAAVAMALLIGALSACAGGPASEAPAQRDQATTVPPPPPPPPAPPPPPGLARQSVGVFASPVAPPVLEDRERYEAVDPNPVRITAEEPVSTFSIDVDTASYANVRRFLTAGEMPPTDAVRIEEMINYFDYDDPLPEDRRAPFATAVTVTDSPWAPGRHILRIGLQGYDLVPAQRPPLNLVLLLDVSGSMAAQNKLPLAIQGFRALIAELTARDHVAIVVYAGAAGAVLEPTPGDQQGVINAALDRLQAGGSTAGGEGLALAYTLARRNFDPNAVNRIILATDGDFNVGVTDNQRLEDFVAARREDGVYLSVLGFGGGNYNDALMQTLAQNGNGNAAYIDTPAEARRFLVDDLSRNLFPIADDVKIQVEFNPAVVAEYRLIGYETRLLRREDFENDAVDAGEVGAGANVTALYEITLVGGPTANAPLRYQQAAPPAAGGDELAFVRIRYKLPGEDDSREISRPITRQDMTALAAASESARFAIAVAGFGQLLRGDAAVGQDYGYDDVLALAQGARGADPYGWRAELVQLVRAAQAAAARTRP